MTPCGIWPATQHLLAVVADDDGRVADLPRKASHTDEARWTLLSHVEGHQGLDCTFVVTSSLAHADPIARLAACRGATVLVVANHLVDDLRVLAAPSRASARQLALLLARLPLCIPVRQQLRLLRAPLPLFAAR